VTGGLVAGFFVCASAAGLVVVGFGVVVAGLFVTEFAVVGVTEGLVAPEVVFAAGEVVFGFGEAGCVVLC
jgi:hypothetical protein